jgi:hypothetical protein
MGDPVGVDAIRPDIRGEELVGVGMERRQVRERLQPHREALQEVRGLLETNAVGEALCPLRRVSALYLSAWGRPPEFLLDVLDEEVVGSFEQAVDQILRHTMPDGLKKADLPTSDVDLLWSVGVGEVDDWGEWDLLLIHGISASPRDAKII